MNRPGRVPSGAALNHDEDWAGSGSMDQLGRLPLGAFPIGKYAMLMTRNLKMHAFQISPGNDLRKRRPSVTCGLRHGLGLEVRSLQMTGSFGAL